MVDDLVDNFFEVNVFMDTCLKFKHNMESVLTPYKEAYNYMQKKAEQVMFMLLSSDVHLAVKSSVSPPAMHCMFYNHLTVLASSNTNITAMNMNKNVFMFVFCVTTKYTYNYMTL